eukprot:360864-Chlamydomonas_euryale.AAC.4
MLPDIYAHSSRRPPSGRRGDAAAPLHIPTGGGAVGGGHGNGRDDPHRQRPAHARHAPRAGLSAGSRGRDARRGICLMPPFV